MAGRTYREPIQVVRIGSTSDTQLGQVASGTDTTLYDTIATIVEKPLGLENTDIQTFQNSQRITFFYNPDQTISRKDKVVWRGKDLIIRSIEFNDRKTEVTLQTVSR